MNKRNIASKLQSGRTWSGTEPPPQFFHYGRSEDRYWFAHPDTHYNEDMANRRNIPIVLPHIEAESCTIGLREKILAEIPFFEALSAADVHSINQRFVDRGFEPGATIIREGESADRLLVVAMGIVKLFRTTESGGTILIDILGSGEYFGSLAGYGPDRYQDTAIARSRVCALSIDSVAFRRILGEHSSVALKAVEALSNRLHLAHEMVRQLGGYSAEARIAYVLLRLADKLGVSWQDSTLIQAPLTREELASMAGTTTETASRAVSRLQKQHIITAGRGWIALTDGEALRELAPEYLQ